MSSQESIAGFLDTIQSGYGEKFADAFDALGVDTLGNLHDLDKMDNGRQLLEEQLIAAGAKVVHLSKIRKGL